MVRRIRRLTKNPTPHAMCMVTSANGIRTAALQRRRTPTTNEPNKHEQDVADRTDGCQCQ